MWPVNNHQPPRPSGHALSRHTLSLIVSFLVALLVCCMLAALTRVGASLELLQPRASPSTVCHPHLSRTQTHAHTRHSTTQRPTQARPFNTTRRSQYGHLYTRPHYTTAMFRKAVQDAAVPPPTSSIPTKQQSIGSTFARNAIHNTAAHLLSSGLKHNGAGTQVAVGGQAHGVKRTSSGFAKQLSSQDDMFNYPTLNIAGMEKENQHPIAYNAPSRGSNAGLATALFDDDDFDSDVDLDIEDPSTKGTVSYPQLPQNASNSSDDFGYLSRPQTAQHSKVVDSSQPIPWSSSPVEHFKTPQKPEPLKPRTRRAHLPWSQNQQMRTQQQPEERIESDEEAARPKKRQSTEAKDEVESTPKSKPQFLWNTTASGLKQQQKNLRELNKKTAVENEAELDDNVKAAIKKKKKNSVHRIFLSEEQQNVLNLVTEYKKSVFFTGSAGMARSRILLSGANTIRYW